MRTTAAELVDRREIVPGPWLHSWIAPWAVSGARAGQYVHLRTIVTGGLPFRLPLPIATDDHQTANARDITQAGGARTIIEEQFTPEVLARQIEAMAADPQALVNAAGRSLSVGKPHAASDLADLVERVGGGLAPVEIGPVLSPRVSAGAPTGGVPA